GMAAGAEPWVSNSAWGEAGLFQQHSRAVAQVLPEFLYPSPAANVIAEFSVPDQVAETFQSDGSRLVWRHPLLDIRLRLHLDMDAQFFFNVPQDALATKQGAQPRHENVEPFHNQPP